MADHEVVHQKGQSVGNALAPWRKVRDQSPDSSWQDEFVVWGQPSAWADAIICAWVSDYIRELYPQTLSLIHI